MSETNEDRVGMAWTDVMKIASETEATGKSYADLLREAREARDVAQRRVDVLEAIGDACTATAVKKRKTRVDKGVPRKKAVEAEA